MALTRRQCAEAATRLDALSDEDIVCFPKLYEAVMGRPYEGADTDSFRSALATCMRVDALLGSEDSAFDLRRMRAVADGCLMVAKGVSDERGAGDPMARDFLALGSSIYSALGIGPSEAPSPRPIRNAVPTGPTPPPQPEPGGPSEGDDEFAPTSDATVSQSLDSIVSQALRRENHGR